MLYRKMPKTGDSLSALGFGCMRLPVKDGRIDEPRAIAQIRHAVDQGVNYLDSAWPYHGGESEPLMGRALRDGYREKVKIATKLPTWLIETREDMDRYLDAQLARIGVDCIDYYLLHTLRGGSWERLVALGVKDFMDRALADGRIGSAGFSFHGLHKDFIRIVDDYDWTFCQIQYNFLDQDYQAGTRGLEYAAQKGLGVVVMEPLRGGNLGLTEAPPDVAKIWDKAPKKRSPAEWGLLWVWNRPEVTVVLSGMNEEAHVKENLATAATALPGVLSEAELSLVDEVAATYRRLMPVGCTGCAYCMPCPANVNIPGAFELLNALHMFKKEELTKLSYTVRLSGVLSGDSPAFASQCVGCGECLDKCPQQIQVPDMLEKVVAELEGSDLPERIAMVRKNFLEK